MTVIDTSRRAKAYRAGRQGNDVEYIIIHWWGDPANNPTFDGTVSYFERGGNNTSAHYVVEANRIANMVDDNDTSYAAGTWTMNLKSINIECNPRASDADKATVAELVIRLREKYPRAKLIGHRDVVPTACPGTYYPPNVTLAPWFNMPAKPVVTPVPPTIKDEEMITYADVQPLFLHYLGRDATPDDSMFRFIRSVEYGQTSTQVAAEIAAAPEAINYAITLAWSKYLGRTPSDTERANRIALKQSWNTIMSDVANSDEARAYKAGKA